MGPYQNAKYTEIDGCDICYVDEGEGPALLLVHGLGGSMTNWTPTIEHFSNTHRVVALDLPGHGRSSIPDGDAGVELFARTVRGLLSRLGIEKVSIAGNSMGGLLSMYLALEHPEMIENLVLVDSAGGHRFPRALGLALRRLPARWLRRMVLFFVAVVPRYRPLYRMAGVYSLNEYTRVLLDEATGTARRPDVDRYMDWYVSCARMVMGVCYAGRCGEITRPTLLVWGQKDMGVPLKIGQSLNVLINGSYLVAIARAAHVPQLDQPELFNAAVERFLAAGEAPAAPRPEQARAAEVDAPERSALTVG
ncbi:MAG: alpha/beta hydrolase [Actinomycetota bacterium]